MKRQAGGRPYPVFLVYLGVSLGVGLCGYSLVYWLTHAHGMGRVMAIAPAITIIFMMYMLWRDIFRRRPLWTGISFALMDLAIIGWIAGVVIMMTGA